MKKPYQSSILKSSLVTIMVLSFLLGGCSSLAPQPTVTPTLTFTPVPTNTPLPTNTATPTSTSTPTQTPTSTPTATPDAKATKAAQATATSVALEEMVKPNLNALGIPPENGHVVWYSKEPVKLETNSYGEERYYPLEAVGSVDDFVLRTKITWDSTGGLAGCGVNFRAEEDFKNGAYYSFLLMRLQFQPMWSIDYFKFGKWQASLTPTGYMMSSSAINDDKGSKNELVLIAQGEKLTPYFNNEKQSVSLISKLKGGRVALMASQESGKTSCVFEDTYIWMFNK